MPAKNSKSDPLFGTVRVASDWWYGSHHSVWIDKDVEVMVPLEGNEPSHVQRRLFKEFLAKERALQSSVEQAIFDWYRDYLKNEGGDFDRPLPDITSSDDVWNAVNFSSLCIPDMNDDDRFEILFGGDWEEEHGCFVALKQWKVVAVLYQGSGY